MPATAGWKLIFTMAALTRACSLQPLPVQPRSSVPLPFAALQAPEVYMALGVLASSPAPPRPALHGRNWRLRRAAALSAVAEEG